MSDALKATDVVPTLLRRTAGVSGNVGDAVKYYQRSCVLEIRILHF